MEVLDKLEYRNDSKTKAKFVKLMIKYYADYGTNPKILGRGDRVKRKDEGATLFPSSKLKFGSRQIFIPEKNIFDLVTPTYFSLLENLVPGSDLMDKFLRERTKIERGVWVYYPKNNDLVKFAPEYWHRTALVMRNSTLLRDQQMKLSWLEIRKKFESTVISIAGCSVGSNIAYAIAGDIRPKHMKIADYKQYNISNANRARIHYSEFGENKARVVAENIHSNDPFMGISVFDEGINKNNVHDFIMGNKRAKDPPSDVIIEEVDDPDVKILIREIARENRIPVIMGTDIGSVAQIDLSVFHKNENLPLTTCGMSDMDLYQKRDLWKADLASRDKFLDFAFALVGKNYEMSPEFANIVNKSEPDLFAGTPQLGSTAMIVGGLVAEITARLILGFALPERMIFNKITGEGWAEGKIL